MQLWKSGGNFAAKLLTQYTRLGILITGEAKEKEELKNLLMRGKFSVHVMVVRELFRYVKNKK